MSSVCAEIYDALEIKRDVNGTKREMCAKSILPPFVARLVKDLQITSEDTFYDLGCGNGSVVFQVALMTGAKCVGVELNKHNAEVATLAWASLKPRFERDWKKLMPEVIFISGDLEDTISASEYSSQHTVAWFANLLMPLTVTHTVGEVFLQLPPETRLGCMTDPFPHSRGIRLCNRKAFRNVIVKDIRWTSGTTEWTKVGRIILRIHP